MQRPAASQTLHHQCLIEKFNSSHCLNLIDENRQPLFELLSIGQRGIFLDPQSSSLSQSSICYFASYRGRGHSYEPHRYQHLMSSFFISALFLFGSFMQGGPKEGGGQL